jgi:hypothetical protein
LEGDRFEIAESRVRADEEDRDSRSTDGDLTFREEVRALDDPASLVLRLARALTRGWRRSRASSERARPVVSAALRSMLRAIPSGRAIVISRPFMFTVLRESPDSVIATPPLRRIS